MSKRKFEKAAADWPETTILEKEGAVLLSGRYEGLRTGTIAGVITIIVLLLIAPFTIALSKGGGDMRYVYGLAAAFIVTGVIVAPIYIWLHKKLNVKTYADSIELKGKRYARDVPIEFRVEQHRLAQSEEEREQRTGQKQRRYYREAIEVVMQYGERRIVIAEMRSVHLEMAKSLVIRLQDVCASLDKAVAKVRQELRDAAPVRAEGAFGPAPDIR